MLFRSRPLEDMETELTEFSKKRPLGLILPSLYSELEGKAMPLIISELKQVPYLNQIVIGLDRADETQYRDALNFFSDLPQDFGGLVPVSTGCGCGLAGWLGVECGDDVH